MYLIVASISFSFLGFLFGVAIGGEALAYILGIIGFFAPSMYVLDKLYKKVVMNKEQLVDKIEYLEARVFYMRLNIIDEAKKFLYLYLEGKECRD